MSFSIPFEFHKGDRLDDMTFIRPVARGGNGDLYLARDENEIVFALKVIRKPDNDDERNGIEQSRTVSAHIPGLVPVIKTGKFADGRFYCVMPPADNLAQWPDYVPDTLAARIRRDGRIPPGEVLKVAEKILTTIKDLHCAGLAHCDIKPENILFINGEPMLSDYSLLSDTEEHHAAVQRAPVGTIGYIPPEMLEHPGSYSPAACDLYAVGKLLYCAWTGTDVISFPSVPREIDLHEIGIIRPLYMKACSTSPNGRFKKADEFISAVSDARSRLDHSARTQLQSSFRTNLPVLIFALLVLLCAIGIANVFFLLQIQSGKTYPGQNGIPHDGNATNGNAAPSDPLVVTTNLDVVDANDGANSLREAFNYAQIHGAGATVSFAGDHEIRLSSSLSVTQDIILDGGENRITLIGPETEPMFQVKESRLTLKNMSVISDYEGNGGGIVDAWSPGRVDLFAVKDGGKAELLWNVSNRLDIRLDGESHLHRVRVNPKSKGANILIGAGTILEHLEFNGDSADRGNSNCDVDGLLRNASVADFGDIYVNPGGTAENITVKKGGFLDLRPKGKINGVNVENGGIMGYMTDGIVSGRLSIGGVAWEAQRAGINAYSPEARVFPIVDETNTEIVFDLTERTETSEMWFYLRISAEVSFNTSMNIIEGATPTRMLYYDLASFFGAHSYTVRVGEDQPPGTYLLGGRADGFDSAVSLAIGDTVYHDVLTVGKEVSFGNTVYALSLDYVESRIPNSYLTNYEIKSLQLKIDKKQDAGTE